MRYRNGFKAFKKQAGSIYGKDMQIIKKISKKIYPKNLGNPKGKTENVTNVIQEYQNFVENKIQIQRKIKIVADTANGTCGLVAPELFKRLGCNVLTINKEPDGTFPAHLPVPNAKTLVELMNKVVENRADFGVGYDGDGDRAVFIDEKGNLIPGDLTLLIFTKDYLQKYPGGKVVFEISCSMAVEEYVKANGGIPIVERVVIPLLWTK